MNIGEAAASSGVSAKMIRYYEQTGLLPAAKREANGYRYYGDTDVHMLRFIRRARDLGFSLEQVEQLVALWRDKGRASAEVKAIAQEHVRELEEKIAALESMRRTLEQLVHECHGDHRADCPILDDLSGMAEES
ncbi:MAG: Cu(I)-responsive transcriptional regulator [Thioalkalivibrio sp.]